MILEFAARNFAAIPHLHERIRHILALLEKHFSTPHQTYNAPSRNLTLTSALLHYATLDPLSLNQDFEQALRDIDRRDGREDGLVPEVPTHISTRR